ncbi:MAG: 5-(carboxyamino)imidazole ribonucleotide synthase [Saprospiraceae bacterium]
MGAGQLGRMLAQKASEWDLDIAFLDKAKDFPAGKVNPNLDIGDFKSYEDVLAFGRTKDIISIEIENVNTDALLVLEKEGKKVIPSAEIIATIKDKGLQKQYYKSHKLPSSEFQLFADKKSIIESLDKAEIQLPFIQKSREAGYDGKGVQLVKDRSDIGKIMDTPSVIEKMVDIHKEVALIVARNEKSQIQHFDPVEMVFDPEANLLDYLLCPADIDDSVKKQMEEIADKLVSSWNFTGLLAIEFFIDKNSRVLINEVAPRTHNSGHHSIDCCESSQFEMQLRTLLNLDLVSGKIIYKYCGIVNLVGEADSGVGPVNYEGLESILKLDGVYPHIYGKQTVKPFRKMGHVTVAANTKDELQQKIQTIKKSIRVISW